MRKIFLFPTLCLCMVSGLAAPRILYAESGLVFDAAKGAMTGQLDMGNYALYSSSAITAARYQINGSTVLAILSGDVTSFGIGVNAGRLNTGQYNVFAGIEAGYSNTTGMNNSFFGDRAGRSNTSDANSIFGSRAGYYNTSGADNSFMGTYAGYANDTGAGNAFMGSRAGYYNVTGSYNVLLGFYAGTSNLASYNSFLGSNVGYYNTTGANNSLFGYKAGYQNRVGSANTILGNEAGNGVNTYSFSSSTLVGYRAGFGLTTGSDNILLGWQAGYNVTTGAGNIVIGYNKDASVPGANNELNIGGVLYGDLSAKTIGISTRVPQAALDIVSTGTAQTQFAQLWRDSDGVVKGSMSATGVMMAAKFTGDGSGLSGISAADNTKVAKAGDTMTGQLTLSGSTLTVIAPTTVASSLWVSTSDITPHLYVSTTGNIGIGTAGPGGRLDVVGSATVVPLIVSTGTAAGSEVMKITSAGKVGIGTTDPLVPLMVVGPGGAWGNDTGIFDIRSTVSPARVSFGYSDTGNYGWIRSVRPGVANDYLVLNPDGGNVGIGTTNPQNTLHVAGVIRQGNATSCSLSADVNGVIACTSDERAKDILAPFKRGIGSLVGIKPIVFSYKKASGLAGTFAGFSAQNVKEHIPEAVSVQSSGLYGLDDKAIVAALVNAVQEQQAEIGTLKAQNQSLQLRLEKLEIR